MVNKLSWINILHTFVYAMVCNEVSLIILCGVISIFPKCRLTVMVTKPVSQIVATLVNSIHIKCVAIILLYKTELTLVINQLIGLVGRVFVNGPGDLGSIPGRVIPKTLKIVLNASLLNTQQYKVRIKGKMEQPREKSSALYYTLVS